MVHNGVSFVQNFALLRFFFEEKNIQLQYTTFCRKNHKKGDIMGQFC